MEGRVPQWQLVRFNWPHFIKLERIKRWKNVEWVFGVLDFVWETGKTYLVPHPSGFGK